MDREQQLHHLQRANEVARDAMARGCHPFGAIRVGADGRGFGPGR